MSAYGGVICLNRRVDRELAEALVGQFIEVLFARGYDEDALEVLARKPNMRILDDRERRDPERDRAGAAPGRSAACSSRTATPTSRSAARCRSSPSAARPRPSGRSCCSPGRSASTCARTRSCCRGTWRRSASAPGQMSRVDAVRLAIEKARSPLSGAVMASDAYFPFADGPAAGARCRARSRSSSRAARSAIPRSVEAVDAAGRGDGVHQPPALPPLTARHPLWPGPRGSLALDSRICQADRQRTAAGGADRPGVRDHRGASRRSSVGRAADF